MKSFSLSVGKKPSATKVSRPAANSHFEHDAHTSKPAGAQLISAFDTAAGGAIDTRASEQGKPIGPLVIKPPRTRDWRENARGIKRKNLLPEEEQARRAGKPAVKTEAKDGALEEEEPTYGLVIAKRRKTSAKEDTEMAETETAKVEAEELMKVKTEDDEAMEALLGDGKQKKSTLVIPGVAEASDAQPSEKEILRSDLAQRPASPTVEDYDVVKIEDFGMGMLRGQGLREGGLIGRRNQGAGAVANGSGGGSTGKKTARLLERRPQFLGIGAKHAPKDIPELGAWGKGLKKQKVEGYNPIVLRNKRTGEIMTEEERRDGKERDRGEEGERRKDRSERREDDRRSNARDRSRDNSRDRDYDRKDRKRHRDRDDRDDDRRDYEKSRRTRDDRERGYDRKDHKRDHRERDYDRKDRDRRRERDHRGERDDKYRREERRDREERHQRSKESPPRH